MADNRELTFGMDFGLDDAINRLGETIDRLEQIVDRAQDVEDAAQDMGARVRAGTDAIRDGARDAGDALDDLEDDADDVGTSFRDIGREADSFGAAVGKSMGAAAKETNSVSKTIKAGFDGAIGYSQKKFSDFTGKVKTGVKGIGTAFTHPINTIRGKFLSAVEAAADRINNVGDEADDARKDLDDMGDEGDKAGGEIKEAIKGALAAFIGFEAIQAGIDMLKELGAAAIEAAGSAENVGRKFEANFSGTDAGEWAENYADAIHRSSDEVKSFMVSNKALYGEMGITGDAAAELSKATTSLAYDFGNAFAMDDTEALGVVQDYISGNNAALEEYGIHIDEVALKNTALSMGLGDQIDEMDDATLAQVRMNALLGQTEKIQQSAANSTGGLVNSTKDLKGIWSEFMADAGSRFTPVITELGMTLLPVLTDVLGTVFEAGLPLLQVFGDLAQTILPPVADIIGMIAETVMPPLVDILNTLNTSIIQPLVPVIQKLAEALLPPIAQLLGLISPILEAVSPVLEVIGDVLGVIAEVLGKVVGWLADGVGKVVGFFSNLFGGAKDSEEAVNDLSGSINGLDDAASKETSLVVDTSQYKEEVTGAAETTTEAVTESSNQAAEITDVNFMAMGASATAAYGTMQTDAETAWSAMQTAATTGTDAIVAQFSRITAAAREASNASNVQIGASIPHNAGGTDNFEGGPTWMNEEGGELAILPGGSAIIPADQTDRLMKSYTNNTTNNRSSRSVSFAPSVQITIAGNADSSTVANLKEQLRALFDELYQEAQAQDYTDRAMQAGFA